MTIRRATAPARSASEIHFESAATENVESFRELLASYLARLEAEEVHLRQRAAELAESLAIVRRFVALMPSFSAPDSATPAETVPRAEPVVELVPEPPLVQVVRRAAPDATPLPVLHATLFGEFRLSRGGQRVRPAGGTKVWKVLKFLIAHDGGPVSRDVLVDTFWRSSRGSGAAHSIHSAVHAVRGLLAGSSADNYIVCDAGCYQFAPGVALFTDVAYFQSCLAESRGRPALADRARAIAALTRAVAAYTAPALTDEPYDGWAAQLRESLASRHLDALVRLARFTAEIGDVERSAEWHHAVLAVDPLAEDSHRALIEHFGRTGQRALAVRQFRALEKELKVALGLQPGPRTRAALDQVLAAE